MEIKIKAIKKIIRVYNTAARWLNFTFLRLFAVKNQSDF